MYRLSPLTYFFEGLAVTGLANADVTCSSIEMQHISLPPASTASTCADYLAPYIQIAGGYVENPSGVSDCQYCPVANANAILTSFGMSTHNAWRDVSLLAAYVVFNVAATFGIYWFVRVPRRPKISGGAAGTD